MADKTAADTAATAPAVKVDAALTLQAEVAPTAKLPQAIAAALTIARANRCNVAFTWLQVEVLVSAADTYQGVQRRVQRKLNPQKTKK
jgi:hypothetical protein